MTRETLIKAIEQRLGVTLVEIGKLTRAELAAVSPTGTRLFTVHVYDSGDDGWQFGGCGSLLAEHWRALCHIHEEKKP